MVIVMPSFDIIEERGVGTLRICFRGVVRLEDLIAAFETLTAREHPSVGRRFIWDMRSATIRVMTREHLHRLVDYLQDHSFSSLRNGGDAIVVAGKVDLFIGQIWEVMAENRLGRQDRVFDDIADAYAWVRSGPTAGRPDHPYGCDMSVSAMTAAV